METPKEFLEDFKKSFRFAEPKMKLYFHNQEFEPMVAGSRMPFNTLEIDFIASQGIKTIISLHPINNQRVIEYARKRGISIINHRLEDQEAPTAREVLKGLKLIREGLNKGKVLLHCMGGMGRTGTMLSFYIIDRFKVQPLMAYHVVGLTAETPEQKQQILKLGQKIIEHKKLVEERQRKLADRLSSKALRDSKKLAKKVREARVNAQKTLERLKRINRRKS